MSVLRHGLVPPTATGYNVERSLRFNSADSAYLNRTPGSAGNRKTWTLNFWIKRSFFNADNQHIFGATSDSYNTNYVLLTFIGGPDERLRLTSNGHASNYELVTTQVFRDVSAWYMITIAFDTTQATASNRIKFYVNGTQITAFGTATYPTQNLDSFVNNNIEHTFGTSNRSPNGYLADIHLIDGSALTPSSFGENDTDTGVWKPKAYTGSYGTNGFKLTFSDNSGTTSTTLGKDTSGNGNNWTPNNFSVTAGADNDSLVDTPTPYGTDTGAGGEVRGNYATFNPIAVSPMAEATLANGNLQITGVNNTSYSGNVSTQAVASGKWYAEYTVTTKSDLSMFGIINVNSLSLANGVGYGFAEASDCWMYGSNGYIYNNASASAGLSTYTDNDVVNVAVDYDAGKLWFGKNGTWYNSGVPSSGTNASVTFTPGGKSFYFAVQGYGTSQYVGYTNFGQRPFAYTAPSGFKALCTTNLPTPTIGATSSTRADDYFNTVLYTGNGTSQSINAGLQADLLWLCPRSNTGGIRSYDILNYGGPYTPGVSSGSYLRTITTDGLYSGTANGVTELTSTGFSVSGTGSTTNASSATYVGWNWKANGSGSSNTAGSITSTVSANTTAGFSIVTYTGNGSAGATVGHGLGVAPSMVIVKMRSAIQDWLVYHSSLGNTKALFLQSTDAAATNSLYWNDTSPTSSLVTLGSGNGTNKSGETYVAYCFAPVAGYSAFGSYTGNGSADGPFVYTGMRPAFVMIKRTDDVGEWVMKDTTRSPYNTDGNTLLANRSDAEYGSGNTSIDELSNGFKCRTTSASANASGGTYIYMAFAQNPFKYSLAR